MWTRPPLSQTFLAMALRFEKFSSVWLDLSAPKFWATRSDACNSTELTINFTLAVYAVIYKYKFHLLLMTL